ncbi:PAS domain S-box protein [Haladaptatus sp. F3-133]|uniref:histidine kinase n=1 Tax=Halorutilus salinus TaxID=2487751 RepID=A0A9Q4C332_9EURY|nr:PAS domain S-box protein [Halorutilus salinus]MCX2818156.1 PAS domain S-box protein [Halorutilus salinus]
MESISLPGSGGFPRKATIAVVGETEPVHDLASSVSGDILFENVEADEAVRRVAEAEVDCVVSALYGRPVELLRKVREEDPEVPFVAFSDADDADGVLEAGATEHVAVPVEELRGVGRRLRRYAEGRRSRRSERKLDSFMRHTPDQVWVHDADGEVLDVNRQACEALGYDRDELIGSNIGEFEVGADPGELKDRWSKFEYGDSVVVEGRHRDRDGREFPVEVNVGKVLMDGNDRFLAIVRDTTQRETVEKSLRRLRNEHEKIFDNVQDPVFLIDVEEEGESFVFKHLNPAYEEQVGVSEDEARGRTPVEVFGEAVGTELVGNYRRCVEEAETQSYEETIQVPVGQRTYHTKITPVFSGDEVTAIVGSAHDITEQKERERELERYEAYIGNASDIISHLDAEGTVLYESPSVERVFGTEQDDWVGDNVFERVHPDDRARVAQEFIELVEGDRNIENVEFRMEHADGSYVWIEAVGTDWRGSDLGGVVVSSRDITERKERERKLERNRDLLYHTEKIADTGGWEIDPEGDGIRWTDGARRIHGVDEGYEPTIDEAIGFYHPDDREKVREVIRSFGDEQESFDEELRIRTPDGEERWTRSRGEVVRDDGEVAHLRGAMQDITERKEREKSLKEQKRLLEERKEQIDFFNSLLRHDMLNSMTVIRGRAQELLDRLSEDDEGYESAEKVYRRADDVVDLTNRVRSVLRRITGEDDRELSRVDLAQTVRDRAESLGEVYEVGISVDAPQDAYVEADDFLSDIVDNLLINAVEHNDSDEPRVDVSVDSGDEATVLRVADNGSGIPDEMKKAVFGQGEKGRRSGGTGFGLYFVDSMVSEYGGEVHVEDNEADGATVVVELPKGSGDGGKA